ncbi:MAG: VWA domain-containing protein [Gammaproteobacteria bacterium]|nr:VWA domain-containing protein [Gammaproteobacteria bacterium]
MAKDKRLPSRSARADVNAFLDRVATTPSPTVVGERGRLIFALDATASRQPTWEQATQIQAEMFTETSALGGLEVQLCFYRGYREFSFSPWYSDSDALLRRMTSVFCLGGLTQIGRVLRHAIRQTKENKVDALVFVGDCVEEDVDRLCDFAGQLGIHGVPAFLFHEGRDPRAARAFDQIAELTDGACCPFDANSPRQLKELLSAVAVYAAGGHKALRDFSADKSDVVRRLTHQLNRK